MNCELAQRQLLASDSPGEPSAETRRHLAECPSCRIWQQQLAEMEQQLPLLLTPPSQRKDEVVRQFLDAVEPATTNGTMLPYAPILPFTTPPPRERGLRKASLAIAMAAGLALFALGWWAWQHPPEPPTKPDPLAAYRAERDHLLGRAPTPQAKVEVLAKLADQHHQEALTLAQQDDAEKLSNTAQFYIELVRENLPDYAKDLPPAQRAEVLSAVAQQLQDTESSIQKVLVGPVKLTNRARNKLEQMAAAALNGRDRLLAIQRGEA
jgi:cyclophilin family peptidyl-prolyl cis-trans isomerase